MVAILCDKYVVPSIELICEGLNIPDEMACASFLAFGEAAPEIMISILATIKGKFSMGMGGILGSAIIAFGLIPSGAAVVAPKGLTLMLFPIVRDTATFILALSILMGATHDEEINLTESIVLLVLFFVYMLVIFSPKIYQMCCKRTSSGSKGKVDYDAIPTSQSAAMRELEDEAQAICAVAGHEMIASDDDGEGQDLDGDGGDEDDDEPEGCMKIMYYCCLPIYWTFRLTMPDLEDESKCRHLYPLTFLISMIYITLLSQAIIEVTEEISRLLGMTTVLASVTFIAMGAQVPDTMSALMLARAGHDDGAISHAISSQVMNIVLGIGIPCGVYNLMSGPVPMNLGGLHVTAVCVYVLVFLYLGCLLLSRCITGKIWLGRAGGLVLFIAYVAVTVFIGLNECCLKLG